MSKEPVRPAVWAVTIAVAFSYMGVGVVDPILPEISSALKASPGQTELLFSTYLFVSAALMFFASWVATRIGRKKTLLVGLAIIVTFAAACALSGHVDLIIGFRGGWGVGNALFVSTALATVLGASAEPRRAIMLYEGALGAGMALGPLVGDLVAWPFPRHSRSHGCRTDRHCSVRPAYTDRTICTPLGNRTIPCPRRFAGVDPHVGGIGLQLWLLHPAGVRALSSS